MKRRGNYFLYILLFVLLLFVCVLAYRSLTKKYTPADTNEYAKKEDRKQTTDFTVYDGDNMKAKLSDSFGKPIVVNFWATWCGPCTSELPSFSKLYEEYKDDVIFMMVNMTDGYSDSMSSVKAYVSDNGYSFPVYYDIKSDAARAYGIRGIPCTLFIDSSGVLLNSVVGAMNESKIRSNIDKIIAAT